MIISFLTEETKLQQMYNSFLSKVCQLGFDSSPLFHCLPDFMKSFCSVMPRLTILSLSLRIHKENGIKLRKSVIKLLIKHNLWPFHSGQLPVQLVGQMNSESQWKAAFSPVPISICLRHEWATAAQEHLDTPRSQPLCKDGVVLQ